jgi:uncharacterized membrane protein YqjE
MSFDTLEARNRLAGLFVALGRLSATLASVVEGRMARAMALYRLEVQRTASIVALTLAAAFLACAAVGFIALAVMIAFWPTHPVVASAAIAAVLAALAGLAVLRARGRSRDDGHVAGERDVVR